jgi:hypothetical protein
MENTQKKLENMKQYIDEKIKNFSSIEIAEYSLRKRSYFNAFKMQNIYVEKLADIKELCEYYFKDRSKEDKIMYSLFGCFYIANYIFDFLSQVNLLASIGVALTCVVISKIADKIEASRFARSILELQSQIDFYGYETDRFISGRISYVDEFLKSKENYNNENSEEAELIRQIYLADVDIAVINGMNGNAGVFDL